MSTESPQQSEIMTVPEEKGCGAWNLFQPTPVWLPNWTKTLEGQVYFSEFVFLKVCHNWKHGLLQFKLSFRKVK